MAGYRWNRSCFLLQINRLYRDIPVKNRFPCRACLRAFALIVVSVRTDATQAHPLIDQLLQAYELVGGYECQKPRVPDPPMSGPVDADEHFGVERRFIDLDGGRICQIMDVWVEQLSPVSPNQRVSHSSIFVFQDGKWTIKGADNPAYFPYTLRNKKTGGRYFLTPVNPSAEDADWVTHGGEWLKFKGWTDPEPVRIVPDARWDDPSSLKQGLAVLLTKRLTPEELSQPPHEKKNLRALIARDFAHSGNMFQPPENQLPLNQYGLPNLTK